MQACLQEKLFSFYVIRRMPDSEKEPKGGFELGMANGWSVAANAGQREGAERRIRAGHGEWLERGGECRTARRSEREVEVVWQ